MDTPSSPDPTVPIRLASNYITRFYRGGVHLGAFRGVPIEEYQPEDWVGSITSVSEAQDGLGMSRLPDGRWLADAVAADPAAYLGAAHLARFGASTELLVKLLDAGERLPVHCHPSRAFAAQHLGCCHGKTEAWVILAAPADGAVYLGFRETVPAATLNDWLERQDSDAMLAAMNRIPVRVGDAVLVPGGTPHAIGAGVFLTEVQEPTDFSVLLEWKGYDTDGPREGHLGLGYETALTSVDHTGWSPERLAGVQLREPLRLAAGVLRLLPAQADPYFQAERVNGGATLEPGFSVLVVTDGELEVTTAAGRVTRVHAGETYLLPFATGACRLAGTGSAVRCRPPDPAVEAN